jgi:hypothetical protein
MACRVDFVMKGVTWGWQESWYNPNSATDNVMAQALASVPSRNNLLGNYGAITGVRVTLLSGLNATLFESVAVPAVNPDTINPATTIDTPWDSILCRVTGSDGTFWYHRSMWLRGVQDQFIQFAANGTPNFSPAIPGLVNSFLNAENRGGLPLYMRVIDKTAGVNNALPITGIATGGGPPSLIVLSVATSGYTVGQTVRVSGCRGQNLKQAPPGRKGVNGLWQVTAVTSTTVSIGLPYYYLPGTPVLRVAGKIRSQKVAYVPITQITPIRYGSRLTGRVKQPMRGRKANRRPSI